MYGDLVFDLFSGATRAIMSWASIIRWTDHRRHGALLFELEGTRHSLLPILVISAPLIRLPILALY